MAYTYTENTNNLGIKSITRIDENGVEASIPCDPANSDYQAYLNKDKPVEHFTPIVSNAD